MLCLSARSKAARDGNTTELANHRINHPDQDLADIARTQ
jgi:acyl transferase domain-containing protein